MRNRILILFISILLYSCGGDWMGEQTKPKGRGEPGEIVLVIDSARWAGEIGSELRKTFRETVEGLPRDEPMFDLRQVSPFQFKGILRQAKNLILFVPMNDNARQSMRMRNFFTQNALDSMRNNQNIFLVTRQDLFATDQHVLFMISHGNDEMVSKIQENRERLQTYFNRIEDRRTYKKLYNVRGERLIINNIKERYNFSLKVPFGWKIATEKEDFLWLRLAGQEIDKNIFVAYKPYTNEDQFIDENLIEWRNEIAKKYIYGDPSKVNSFVITEPLIPPVITEVNFNGKYAKKMIGRWKTNNITMGGPFVSYIFVDESINRIYYIEGFVFSPGVEQREIVRELDVILNTFKLESED